MEKICKTCLYGWKRSEWEIAYGGWKFCTRECQHEQNRKAPLKRADDTCDKWSPNDENCDFGYGCDADHGIYHS